MAVKYASFKNPFMDSSKHLRVGTLDLMRQLKSLISHKIGMRFMCIERLVGVLSCSLCCM